MENQANLVIHEPEVSESFPKLIEFAKITRRHPGEGQNHLCRDTWGLDYHFEDAGFYSLDGRTWHKRKKGMIHLYSPQTNYWERRLTQDLPFTETWMVFTAENITELDTLVAGSCGFAKVYDSCNEVHSIFSTIIETACHQEAYWQSQNALLSIFQLLFSAQKIGNGEFLLKGENPVLSSMSERVNNYLKKHYHRHLTLGLISKEIGVSRSTLTHKYHKETGTTPMKHLTEYRLNIARSMILRGEQLKVVAAETGFYDEFHMSKVFRQHFGFPPSTICMG